MAKEAARIECANSAADAFAALAAEGRFELQTCRECRAVFWPPRDICGSCWSTDLEWRAVLPFGELIAEATLHTSLDAFFRERLPWRIGSVRLDAGPIVLAHLADDAREGARVRVIARSDFAGRGVLVALPEAADAILTDSKLLDLAREFQIERLGQAKGGTSEHH